MKFSVPRGRNGSTCSREKKENGTLLYGKTFLLLFFSQDLKTVAEILRARSVQKLKKMTEADVVKILF